MKLGIRTKLFLVSLGLVTLTVGAADMYLTRALDRMLTDGIRNDLFVRVDLVERDASACPAALGDLDGWDALADDLAERARTRVTIIRQDGVVLGDSELEGVDLEEVENHASRPEILETLATGRGSSTRYSTTVKQRMMYVSQPFHRDGMAAGVARVALPLGEVDLAVARLRKTLAAASAVALLFAVFLATAAAHLTSSGARRLTEAARRMAQGDLSVRTRAAGGDEIGYLGRALDGLATSFSRTLGDLEAERDRLRAVLEGMQEGVLLLDRDGRVALVNPALREMLRLGSDAVGPTLLETIRHAGLKDLLDRALSSGEAKSAEIDLPGPRPRRLLVRAAPLAAEPGGAVAVFFDVTDIRRLETIRRDFVANVSHELRTPIAAVQSAAETLGGMGGADPTSAAPFVEIIERNAARLGRLVEDLFDLSRIESREPRLKSEPVELAPLVSTILDRHQASAQAKGIRLRPAIPADTPPVRADGRAVEQVLENLVDNALKYCPAGCEVRVEADVERDRVRIRVEDDGPGIEPKHLPRLFERFYRVDAGRSRDIGGTGLGLSIVKHLVETMGGEVSVASAPGRGSSFRFSLPRC